MRISDGTFVVLSFNSLRIVFTQYEEISMAAGITMKIAYGHKVESANDEFVAIGDKGVATIDAAGTVGAHIVDFIPWRELL